MTMKNADYLLKNAALITLDEQYHQYEPGALAVAGDSILAVGPEQQICDAIPGRTRPSTVAGKCSCRVW